MKVLFIHTFYRFKGGEDNLVLDEMALLQGAGFTVELLKFKNPSSFLGALLPVFFLPFNLCSFWAAVKKIRKFQPDVVHVHNWHFAASPSVMVSKPFACFNSDDALPPTDFFTGAKKEQ